MTHTSKKNHKGMSIGGVVAAGASVLAVTAGAYYLAGPDGKKHQKKVLKIINNTEKGMVHGVQSVIEKGRNR